jgi:TusE/DsrC/DsvC family sulfur relay protein
MKQAVDIFESKRNILADEEGFLSNPNDWSEDVCRSLCSQDGLLLTDSRWEVIRFIRSDHEQYRTVPMTKIIIQGLNKGVGELRYTIKHLYELFPNTPVLLLCKYAGLPKPSKCS